ncbi:MAG: YbhB/YbcL family Raf kinase inhibitor-like protein [Chloroflexi bacterium]|jgi:Raf kinase inhibitor-like YbhB/YbcL family protein|nr:YbhB/YbcL family Raf kinase inhibitor-like protein [Chloroflexota bacterium]
MRRIPTLLLIIVGLLAACQAPALDTSNAIKFKLSSPAFADSGSIPQKFTCQGDNVSPELNWSEAPANTGSFALIMDDPDAPGGTFTHWVLFDVPADQNQLAENASPIGMGGNNGTNQTGYMGSCPPSGSHRYYFRLYALDVPSLNLKEGASRREVETAMKGHIIGVAETMGRYEQQ